MSQRSAKQYLADILTNIETARRYLGTLSYEEFRKNEEKMDAIERRLQNASEATRRLNAEWPDVMRDVERRYPDIVWSDVRNFGSVMRHDYDGVEPGRLWDALQSNGSAVRVEEAMRQEIALSQIPLEKDL